MIFFKKTKLAKFFVVAVGVAFYGISLETYANCIKRGTWNATDSDSARINLGQIVITNDLIQPPGTLLGSTIVDWSTAKNLTPETVMFECDLADLPRMFENYSTNGDEPFGGYEIVTGEGLTDVYYSRMRHVGIRVTNMNTGQNATRFWKREPVGDRYEIMPTNPNKILFKGKHISKYRVEAFKISRTIEQLSDLGVGRGTFCGNWTQDPSPRDLERYPGRMWNYTCNQPAAYFAFVGPGTTEDKEGADHNTSFHFFSAYGVGMTIHNSPTTFYYTPSCVFRSVTPVVVFPEISKPKLNAGETREAQFHVDIDCMNDSESGFSTGQVAVGLQANPGSLSKARELGLVSPQGGVSHLVSENYDGAEVARGVGVRLKNRAGENLMFLSTDAPGGGSAAGWMPIKSTADLVSDVGGVSKYRKAITASFEKIPGQDVTVGKYNANAYVVIRIQ